jgi:hypothetical protein
MKYVDLLEFCRLIIETEADESVLKDYHVKADGPIANVWIKIYDAIKENKDFDYKKYLQDFIDNMNDIDDYTKKPRRLN